MRNVQIEETEKTLSITGDDNIKQFSKQNLETIREYLANSDCNFLAFAYTPWHLLGVRAVMEKLVSCDIRCKGVIFICKNQHGGFILDQNSFSGFNSDILPLYIENKETGEGKLKRILHYIKDAIMPMNNTNNSPFYLISPNDVNLMDCSALQAKMPYGSIINYTVDEGLATYMRQKEDFYKEAFEEKQSFPDRVWLHARLSFLDRHYAKKLYARNRIVDFRILSKDGNKWIPNQNSLQYYKKAMIESSKQFLNKDLSYYSGAVVINTQPFAEEGNIKHDEDISILLQVVKRVCSLGHKVVIKFHPRETDIGRYSSLKEFAFLEEDKSVSQESLLASLREPPYAILGFSSTTLITASLFFDVPTISLAALWNFDTITEGLKLEQRRFLNTFSEMLPCPHSFDELIEEIGLISDNKLAFVKGN